MSEGSSVNQTHHSDSHGAKLVLLVPKSYVKAAKVALEASNSFDRQHGISPAKEFDNQEQRMHVPTTIPHADDDKVALDVKKQALLAELQLSHLSSHITITSWTPSVANNSTALDNNPLRRALREALEALPPHALASLNLTVDRLISAFPDSYSIYKPLLLIPSNSLSPEWTSAISLHAATFTPVWTHIATALQCSHIALNSPIPPSNTASSAHASDAENILRSPVNLTPIHGSFGAPPTPHTLSAPSQHDFDTALWVRTTQNGIHQTWAPVYTMFSRGNVKEKARILRLAAATTSAADPQHDDAAATAVDLYAGIGYFAFSYRRAGCARVLCWELNPWSIEGLRRGAALNGWRTRVFGPLDVPSESASETEWTAWRQAAVVAGDGDGDEDLWVFAMSNQTAGPILHCLSGYVDPIRHVNLGLLPVSRPSWRTAVGAVDARLGGWVHAHENVGVLDMEEREAEVESEFQRLADECRGDARGRRGGRVQVEHVERVKMYAPGVVHAVFDVHIPGTRLV